MTSKLKEGLDALLNSGEHQQFKNNSELRQAWEKVCGPETAAYTGSVIFDKKNPDIVIVYTQSSLIKAELEAEKEIYRVQLSALLRPAQSPGLKEIKFLVNRRTRDIETKKTGLESVGERRVSPLALTANEERHAREITALVQSKELQDSLFKAMKTNMEWKKGLDALKKL